MGLLLALGLLASLGSTGTVVMVHGAGGGGWEYDLWRPEFEKRGWKVVAPDLQPARHGLAHTMVTDYQEQVRVWSRHAKRPLVIVGASMGGGLALATSSSVRPDLIVLIGSVPPKSIEVERKPTKFPEIVRWANGPIDDTRAAMPDSDEKTVRWAWKKWRDESGAVMGALAEGLDVPRPECPSLVVWGKDDTDVPVDVGRKIADAFGSDLKEYAGTSHVGPLMGRRAKEVAKDILNWIDARLGPRKK